MPGAFILSDLAAVFNTAEFATAASVRGDGLSQFWFMENDSWNESGVWLDSIPAANPNVNNITVNGIFENSTVEIERDNGKSLPRQATFECPESAAIAIGHVLIIDNVTYKVRYGDYDGTGVVKWYLEKWRM